MFCDWANADVLILRSLETAPWSETQACIVQEALLMKLMVIATSIGGVSESIDPAMTSCLIPPRNNSAIADAIGQNNKISETELQTFG